jgi:fibronectin type 3 domain-containing protein
MSGLATLMVNPSVQAQSPVEHTVALSWKASTNSNVISYSVYRSTISGASYGLLSSAISGQAYVDPAVQSGATYYYVVTAVDDQGRESSYSSQAAITIP